MSYDHKIKNCTVCDILVAIIETVEDELADDSPSFWCQNCFYEMHFDADTGEKVCDFQWRYCHDYVKYAQMI